MTTTANKYTDCFGFTEEEVFAAMDEFGYVEKEERIDNKKQADSRKTDECCISEEGKTALEEKMLEAHDNTLLHVAGRLSNISRQYYVDLFGKTLQMTPKSKSMDEFFVKMESLHEEMEKEIESNIELNAPQN